jgi:hypothetical protein
LRITKLLTIFQVYPSTVAARSSLTGQREAAPA